MNIEFAIFDLIEKSEKSMIIYPFGANGVIAEKVLKRLGKKYLIADGKKKDRDIFSLFEILNRFIDRREINDWNILPELFIAL